MRASIRGLKKEFRLHFIGNFKCHVLLLSDLGRNYIDSIPFIIRIPNFFAELQCSQLFMILSLALFLNYSQNQKNILQYLLMFYNRMKKSKSGREISYR